MTSREKIAFLTQKNPTISRKKLRKETGISRQRLHQILKGYTTLMPEKREKIAKLIDLTRCANCRNHQEKIQIHHKNHNSKDNTIENLLPLCRKCHYAEHVSIRIKEAILIYKNCSSCKNSYSQDVIPSRSNPTLCCRCQENLRRIANQSSTRMWFKPKEKCIDCGNPRIRETYCSKCFKKWKYWNDPIYREKSMLTVRKWQQDNPERWKAIYDRNNHKKQIVRI